MLESCVPVRRKEIKFGRIIWRFINVESDWDHYVEGHALEGPVVCVCREDVLHKLNEMKTGKTLDFQEYIV